ncbi:hypothetical protein [Methanosarcina sp.]|nr:hypothetical protein [Methanosarcina sp.]HOW13820.1 hypothetical protein [Methanosarcina sp.]
MNFWNFMGITGPGTVLIMSLRVPIHVLEKDTLKTIHQDFE